MAKKTPKKAASFLNFFKEVKAELDKVQWPSRQETIKLTLIVILASVSIATYIGLLDISFTKIIDSLLK